MLKNLRYLFSVLLLAVFSVSASAEEKTFIFSELGYDNAAAVTALNGETFSVAFDKGTNNNAPKYYNTGSALRLYGGNTMTITADANYKITGVTLTFASGEGSNAISVTVDGDEAEYAAEFTCEGEEVVYTIGGSTGHRRIATLTVTTEATGSVVTIAKPTFSVASGEVLAGTEVTITAAEGCELLYTVNGTPYSASSGVATVTVNEDMTITAVSQNSTTQSAEATATYTVVTPLTIAQFKALEDGSQGWLSLEGAQVLAVFSSDIYIKDATGAIDLYGTGLTLSQGDILGGAIKGTYTLYKNTPELKNLAVDKHIVTANETVIPEVIATSEIADHICELVTFENVEIVANEGKDYIKDGDAADIQVYNKTSEDLGYGYDTPYNVTGIAILFNSTWEICPRSADDIVDYVAPVQPVQITAAKVATLYNADKALEVPTGVVAYTAKIDEVTGEVVPSVTYNEGDVIPAGEAVILEGAEGSYDFLVAANPGTELDDANVLHGETENGFTSYGAATMSWWYYLLADGPKGIAFYWGADNGAAFPCKEGNAYIALPAGSNAKVLLFGGEATGIKTIDKANVENGAVYNLNGQRVNPTQRGIYIVNGKKVIVK